MKNKIIQVLIFVIFLSLIFNSNIITSEIRYALEVFFKVLFPSIFPFFLISNLLIEYDFVNSINKIFNKITRKLFHSSNSSSFIIIMSMLSGFPSGSKYIKTLCDKNLLSIDEANYLITFTHFANPLFILTITKNMFIDKRMVIYIIISMYLSNLLIGIIIRPKKIAINKDLSLKSNYDFSKSLTNSIKDSYNLLLLILGNTCFFFLVTRLIDEYLPLNIYLQTIINGIFDITKGITNIKYLNLSDIAKAILVLSFISFGGLNINLQVKSIIADTKIKYINFFLGRICQIAISAFLCLFFKTSLDMLLH